MPDSMIAVDWGTTNRRAYLLDGEGHVLGEMEDERGATTIAPDQFPAAVAEIVQRLGDHPLLLAGMIGSNRGWREAPYLPCPATLPELARRLLWIEPGRIAIVPGLAVRGDGPADVMRGEEVQVLGLLQAEGCEEILVCHPGTHTKWIICRDGAVSTFRTAMTGELFALLRDHSILAPLLAGAVLPDADFIAGAAAGLAGPSLAAELFGVRARVLLGEMAEECAAPWVSGLLVGADIAGGLAWAGGQPAEVLVLGRPSLTCLFAAALTRAGVRCEERDGAEAFVAGMHAIWKALK